MEGPATRHAPHGEGLERDPLAGQVGSGLIPVDLRFLAEHVLLRHEGLPRHQAQRQLPFPHVAPHRRLGHRPVGALLAEAHRDPVGSVPLLAGYLPVPLQDRVDELRHRPQPWSRPWSWRLLPWNGTPQRLSHQPPVHPQLRRHASDASDAKLVLPSYRFKQLHVGPSPLHFASAPSVTCAGSVGRLGR